jgi:hypothetical protein
MSQDTALTLITKAVIFFLLRGDTWGRVCSKYSLSEAEAVQIPKPTINYFGTLRTAYENNSSLGWYGKFCFFLDTRVAFGREFLPCSSL